jgi:hypothetical protein
LPLALLGAAAAVLWSRRGVEIWHVADVDPLHGEGP